MASPVAHKRLSDRAFGLLFGTILAGITALGWFAWGEAWTTLGGIGSALFALALIAPGLLMPLNRLWDAFARKLAPITNTLILGIFFYLVVAPVGLAARLFRNDPLERRRDPEAESYWVPVKRQVTTETLKDMF